MTKPLPLDSAGRARQLGSVRRASKFLIAVVAVPLALYLSAAALLSRMPLNPDWREPVDGITIMVATNGVHTSIVLPAGLNAWRAYGWGDREFYANTPRWRDMRPATVLAALIGSDRTVLHVDPLGDIGSDANWRRVRLRAEEYARLRAFIAATQAPGASIPAYGTNDRFYPARGRYSALVTCNVWTGRALAAAGVRVGRWTPFAWDLMRWVPIDQSAPTISSS